MAQPHAPAQVVWIFGYEDESIARELLDLAAVLELQALRVDSEDIYIDRGLGLRAQNRPELQMVLQILHHGDTLVCASMIRLARSHNDLADVVGRLADLGVSVELAGEVLGDMSTAEVLQLSAEFEVELVKEAMAAQAGHERPQGRGPWVTGR